MKRKRKYNEPEFDIISLRFSSVLLTISEDHENAFADGDDFGDFTPGGDDDE